MGRLEKQPETKSDTIIGIAHVRDGKILLVRNEEGEFWYLPGGKVEQGESHEECLRREVEEELNIGLGDVSYYDEFNGVTPYSRRPICALVYLGKTIGDPKASTEIAEIEWTNQPLDKNLTDITREIIERLKRDGFFPTEEQCIR